MGDCDTVLSACTMYRHLESPIKTSIQALMIVVGSLTADNCFDDGYDAYVGKQPVVLEECCPNNC